MTKRQTCFLDTSSYKIVPTNIQGMLRERRGAGKEWSEPCIDRLTRANGGSQPIATLLSSSSLMVKADTCHGMTRGLTTTSGGLATASACGRTPISASSHGFCAYTRPRHSPGDSEGDKPMTISRAESIHVVLTREYDMLLAPIFWLALGCVLGWQDKECYEGQLSAALFEAVTVQRCSGP